MPIDPTRLKITEAYSLARALERLIDQLGRDGLLTEATTDRIEQVLAGDLADSNPLLLHFREVIAVALQSSAERQDLAMRSSGDT